MDALERNLDLLLQGGIVVFIALAHDREERLHIDVEEEARVFTHLNTALQRECQISLNRRKIHWKKCNLEFRKCGIKDCE